MAGDCNNKAFNKIIKNQIDLKTSPVKKPARKVTLFSKKVEAPAPVSAPVVSTAVSAAPAAVVATSPTAVPAAQPVKAKAKVPKTEKSVKYSRKTLLTIGSKMYRKVENAPATTTSQELQDQQPAAAPETTVPATKKPVYEKTESFETACNKILDILKIFHQNKNKSSINNFGTAVASSIDITHQEGVNIGKQIKKMLHGIEALKMKNLKKMEANLQKLEPGKGQIQETTQVTPAGNKSGKFQQKKGPHHAGKAPNHNQKPANFVVKKKRMTSGNKKFREKGSKGEVKVPEPVEVKGWVILGHFSRKWVIFF